MLTRDLATILTYARRLHRGEWAISRLPAALGAERFDREVELVLLGAAMQRGRKRAIGINELIHGTPLEIPVIAHECAHLLLGHDVGYCLPGAMLGRQELDAWSGASLLTVPIAAETDEQWRIRAYSVPRELIVIQHELLEGGPLDEAQAQLRRWILEMAAAISLPIGEP